jgi:hypothetical protein
LKLIDKVIRAVIGFFFLTAVVFWGWCYIVQPAQFRWAVAEILGVPYRIFTLEKEPVLEVATIKQPVLIQYTATKGRWPIQSKLTLQVRYELKIGFDLNLNTAITVDRFNLHTIVKLPRPKILSVEQTDFQVLQSDQAIWMSFSPEEQAQALVEMNRYARESSENDRTLESAVQSLKGRLEQIAPLFDGSIEVIIEPASAKSG